VGNGVGDGMKVGDGVAVIFRVCHCFNSSAVITSERPTFGTIYG
jgi:hypothetical protein